MEISFLSSQFHFVLPRERAWESDLCDKASPFHQGGPPMFIHALGPSYVPRLGINPHIKILNHLDLGDLRKLTLILIYPVIDSLDGRTKLHHVAGSCGACTYTQHTLKIMKTCEAYLFEEIMQQHKNAMVWEFLNGKKRTLILTWWSMGIYMVEGTTGCKGRIGEGGFTKSLLTA